VDKLPDSTGTCSTENGHCTTLMIIGRSRLVLMYPWGVFIGTHTVSPALMDCVSVPTNPFTLQAKHDCIRNRIAVQAILLSWLKAVHVAMERFARSAFERFLFHRMRSLLLIARSLLPSRDEQRFQREESCWRFVP